MWNANSNDGIVQKQGWQSGLEQFKVKVPIGDFLEDIVSDHSIVQFAFHVFLISSLLFWGHDTVRKACKIR